MLPVWYIWCLYCFNYLHDSDIRNIINYNLCGLQSIAAHRDHFFSLLRQEYLPILTSGEMLSHPVGWDKPIPEVIHLWSHRTSMPNNLEKSCLVCVLHIFCTFKTKMRKIINHHIEGGTRESHSRIQDLQHPRLGKPHRGLQILDTWMGFPRPSLNVVVRL